MDTLFNFGGLSREILDKQVPRFSVLPVPYDMTASYVSGQRCGPRAIIEASTHMELYDDELGLESFEAGIETLPFLESTAVGPDKMIDRVQAATGWILDAGRIPVILGGEHSVTLGMVRSLLERYPKMSVLQLDAHADMRDSYQDSPYNHACVARRISELCPIVQAGVRSLSIEEAEFMASEKPRPKKSKGIKTWYARDMFNGTGFSLDKAIAGLTRDVCITIDLDCFDPAIMPATGTPEPGGFDWHGALSVLKKVIEKRRVVGFDVVELCPLPGNIAPDFLAAKLVYKIMGYIAYGKGKGPRKGR